MSLSHCVCGKLAFSSKSRADNHILKNSGKKNFKARTSYRCFEDRNYWHMTSYGERKAPQQNLAVQKITVRKVSWLPDKQWTVANKSGVIVSTHREYRAALNYAIDMTRKKA